MPKWSGLRLQPDAGLNPPAANGLASLFLPLTSSGWPQVITRFDRCHSVTPTEFSVDDYNYRIAEQGLNAEQACTDGQPRGHIALYGSHATTPELAQRDALHLAQRTRQHAQRGQGASNLVALSPGQAIGLIDEATAAAPGGRWLVLAVQAWGDRESPYQNRFTAQPEAQPYRPEWDTPWPEIAGVTHMRVDTTDSANPYARLDEHGRYLAWHYFEHTSGQQGQGSAPLRLARDYAGPTYGQHFPVHAGVEALAGYVHGDPDRPVLLGVLHDSNNVNPVTSLNASRHVSRSWANNKLRLEDRPGQEHIKLSTEYGLGQLNLGHLVNQDGQPRGAARGWSCAPNTKAC